MKRLVTLEERIGYARALFDGEGCISKPIAPSRYLRQLKITNTEKCLLKIVARVLVELGIEHHLHKHRKIEGRKPFWSLRVGGYYNLRKWFELIGTSSPRKQARFEEVFRHPPCSGFRFKEEATIY